MSEDFRRVPWQRQTLAWGLWLEAFNEDPPGETYARPCPSCGSHVTDPLAHLRREHGNTLEVVYGRA